MPFRLRSKLPASEKLTECQIVHPDRSLYSVEVRVNCNGRECLEKMCEILGIMETDYFGLQYTDKETGCNIWINNKLQVKNQVSTKPPFHLKFAVKYYVEPEFIQQRSTLEAFYKCMKFHLKEGYIVIPESKMTAIGAYMAQVEMGDLEETAAGMPKITYPPYFPQWNQGVAHLTAKEHRKLKGMSRTNAILRFVSEVYFLETCGMNWVPAILNGEAVRVGIGGHSVHILDSDGNCLHKFPYFVLTQVSYGNSFFAFNYYELDGDHNRVEKKMRVFCKNRRLARHQFRTVTEQQVFFYQSAVPPYVQEHVETKHKKLRKFCKKVLRMDFEMKYYYDIVRTKHEAYSYAWMKLYQLDQEGMGSNTGLLSQDEQSALIMRQDSEDKKDDFIGTEKSKICWGLSTSSCNIAKKLLSESQLDLTDDDEDFPLIDSDTNEEETAEPLNKCQGKVLRRLLLNIQDGKLCRVCMDEMICSVFCPCGHKVACYSCAMKLDKCPVCRHLVGYVQAIPGSNP